MLGYVPMAIYADVVVVGGGTAGVAAAVSAARAGCDVLLVERAGYLGGTMTAVSLGSLCGYFTLIDDEPVPVVGGLALELVERLRKAGAAGNPLQWLRTASIPYDLFGMKVELDRLVKETGVRLLLHSTVVETTSADGIVHAVRVHNKGGFADIEARIVMDCSGDADIVALAEGSCDFELSSLQLPTAMFRFGGVDTERASAISRPELHHLLEQAVQAGYSLPRTAGGIYSVWPGVVHVNITRLEQDGRAPNPLSAQEMTWAEMRGREQILDYQRAFREFVPGFEDAFVLDSGAQLGVRESRRIVGHARLTQGDVTQPSRSADAVACSAWPVEKHGAGRGIEWAWLEPGEYYQIPFGCLVPQGLNNVLVAGRCVSADPVAQASVRVSAQCIAMGEAVGAASALALRTSREHNLAATDVPALQRELSTSGAFLGDLDAGVSRV